MSVPDVRTTEIRLSAPSGEIVPSEGFTAEEHEIILRMDKTLQELMSLLSQLTEAGHEED